MQPSVNMAGDKICCASYVENGENMTDNEESNVNSDLEEEAKDNPEIVECPEFEFSVSPSVIVCDFVPFALAVIVVCCLKVVYFVYDKSPLALSSCIMVSLFWLAFALIIVIRVNC